MKITPGVHLESIRSLSGVHLDLSQGSGHYALPKNPVGLQVYSGWTLDPVLPKPEQNFTHTNLILCGAKNICFFMDSNT
jgi:hypothetical protein